MKKIILSAALAASLFAPQAFSHDCRVQPLKNLDFKLSFFNSANKQIGNMTVNPKFVSVSRADQTVFVDVPVRSIPRKFQRSNSFQFTSIQRSPFELASSTAVLSRTPNLLLTGNQNTTQQGRRVNIDIQPSTRDLRNARALSYSGTIETECNKRGLPRR